MKSKIVKKKDLDVLIESTMVKAGLIKESNSNARITSTKDFVINHYKLPKNSEQWFPIVVGGGDVGKKKMEELQEFLNNNEVTFNKEKKTFLVNGEESDDIKNIFANAFPWVHPLEMKKESTSFTKPLINEEFKSELEMFNKLSNFKY
jgi:hypothetical protein